MLSRAVSRSNRTSTCTDEERHMLRWALIFFIVAIIAAVLGFGGIAGDLAYIAKILFLIFIVIFLVSLVMGLARGKSPPGV
jgi:uncharacterized membrane protein YtjA (UPF0391 family)